MFLVAGTAVFAQQRGDFRADPEKRAEVQTNRMTEQLGLTDDQRKQVLALNLERTKKMEELRKSVMDGQRATMRNYESSLKEVLTTEQQEKLKANRKEAREKAMEMRQKRGGERTKPASRHPRRQAPKSESN